MNINIVSGLATLVLIGSGVAFICVPRLLRARMWAQGAAYMYARSESLVHMDKAVKSNMESVSTSPDFV